MRVLVLSFLLCGCAGFQEWKAEQDVARYSPYCEKLGFKSGTESFSSCIQQRAAAASAASQAAGAARPKVCTQVGAHLVCN